MDATKTCCLCHGVKPLSGFFSDKSRRDGLQHRCKDCCRKYKRQWRLDRPDARLSDKAWVMRVKESDPERYKAWRARRRELYDPVKDRARRIAKEAVRRGRLVRLPCFCGNEKTHAHHADYSKPLEVEWLCQRHHEERHHPIEV